MLILLFIKYVYLILLNIYVKLYKYSCLLNINILFLQRKTLNIKEIWL